MLSRILCVFTSLLGSVGLWAQLNLLPEHFMVLTNQHVDGLTITYSPAQQTRLGLVAHVHDQNLDLPTNQVIFAVEASAEVTLPNGTPFGEGGEPLWILPQSQNPNLLFFGINSERLDSSLISEPAKIQLQKMEGPGYLMAWQALGPGNFNIRINTRDGLNEDDYFQPVPGSHEHFNWGFSKPGIYALTFKVVAQLNGETQPLQSDEHTFLFHVRPLPEPTTYDLWAKTYWPPGFNPPTTLLTGNSDGDLFANLHEYAFALSPVAVNPSNNAPRFELIQEGNQQFGQLTYRKNKFASDLIIIPEATSNIANGSWEPLTRETSRTDDGNAEWITVRDPIPALPDSARFYRLRIGFVVQP